jgi:hypothetical protein
MGSRAFQIAIVLFWMTSMTWLVIAKLLPPLLVGEPPTYRSTMPPAEEVIAWQIYWNDDLKPLGWAATKAIEAEGGMNEIRNRVVLEDLPLGELLPEWLGRILRQRLGRLNLDAQTRVDIDPLGQLDGFTSTLRLSGLPHAVRMTGQVTDGHLDTKVQVGELRTSNEFRLEQGALVNGDFSPMAVLKGLRVGQTWTQRTFSPLRPPNGPMETLQAIVVGQDWIEWDRRNVSTLLVEFRADSGTGFTSNGPPRGRMWVLKDGRIIQQEVTMLNSKMRFVRLTAAETTPYIDKLDEDWFVPLQNTAEEPKANEVAP